MLMQYCRQRHRASAFVNAAAAAADVNATVRVVYMLLLHIAALSMCEALTRAVDRDAQLIKYEYQPPNGKGDFSLYFETSNAISEKRAGNAHGYSGVVQFVSLEGLPITWTYVADADGYHPKGDHIPKRSAHEQSSIKQKREQQLRSLDDKAKNHVETSHKGGEKKSRCEESSRTVEEKKRREEPPRRVKEKKKREEPPRRVEEKKKREEPPRGVEEKRKYEENQRKVDERNKREQPATRIIDGKN